MSQAVEVVVEPAIEAPKPAEPTLPSLVQAVFPAPRPFAMSPLEMRQAQFASSLSGYSKAEVRAFLTDASESYDETLRENERLRQELTRLDEALKHYRILESSLNGAIVNAQRMADEMRAKAVDEAARVVKEAEERAERIVKDAEERAERATTDTRARMADTEREVDALWLRRREAEQSLESLIEALNTTLDFVRDTPAAGRLALERLSPTPVAIR